MKFIFVSKKVETHIEAMRKNGKVGTTLANKVKKIIGDSSGNNMLDIVTAMQMADEVINL